MTRWTLMFVTSFYLLFQIGCFPHNYQCQPSFIKTLGCSKFMITNIFTVLNNGYIGFSTLKDFDLYVNFFSFEHSKRPLCWFLPQLFSYWCCIFMMKPFELSCKAQQWFPKSLSIFRNINEESSSSSLLGNEIQHVLSIKN